MSLFNRLFRAEEPTRLDEVSQKVQKMLGNDRREFDLAMSPSWATSPGTRSGRR